jgi:beta-aspartyl-peptidase (threonine type)
MPSNTQNNDASSVEKGHGQVPGKAVLVIHGGAGGLRREAYPPHLREKYEATLRMALNAGHAILSGGGCALDAVEATISILEDSPLFNAGKGAVLTQEGKCELEASIMVSHPRAAGVERGDMTRRTTAVTLISRVKNPISLAKALYLNPGDTGHVLHSAPNVETLAQGYGLEMVDETYFHTPARDQQFLSNQTADYAGVGDAEAKGTVGAVALDLNGFIAVGTSTGGKGGKLPGRVGDTPIAGAGYWCEQFQTRKRRTGWRRLIPFMRSRGVENVGMGISGTGDGDFFIRYATCHDILSRMKYRGEKLEEATLTVLGELRENGGEGGVIGLTNNGEVVMGMNCTGMFRGWIDLAEGKPRVGIFCDDLVQ